MDGTRSARQAGIAGPTPYSHRTSWSLSAAGLLSIDLTLLGAFHYQLKRVDVSRLSVFITMSRNVNQIYCIHWCILGFVDSIFCYLLEITFSWPVIYGIGAALLVLSAWLAKRWKGCKSSIIMEE